MKKIAVVTGSSGFIGSHLMEQLARRGYQTRPFDLVNGNDIRNPAEIDRATKGATVVFNLAGILGTHELVEERLAEAIDVNITGAVNILEAARKHGFDVVEIGKPNIWLNTYSITKRAAEDFAAMFYKEFGVRTWIVKWFNIFGPRQHYGVPQKLAPTSIVRALRNQPIPVFGQGLQTADHLYVEDAANAAIDIYECEKVIGKTVEVGSGYGIPVIDWVKAVIAETKSKSRIQCLPMRRGEDDLAKVQADIFLLKNVVGFEPKFTFERALKKTIAYYRKHLAEFED
jgi:UDP-glucose 4-epimerase